MTLRSVPYILFVALLGFSMVTSILVRSGHADVPVAATAAEIEPLGNGENAPRFLVETVDGGAFEFNPDELERPVVLLTFRGGWCPFCNMYLSEMRNAIPEIREMGIDVLFLSGDRPELLFASLNMETQEDIAALDYTILSDGNAQAAMALGIAFKASEKTINRRLEKNQDIGGSSMQRHGVLSVPSVFAIDKNGVIQFAYTNANFRVRLPEDELLAAARKIAAAE